MKQKVASFFAVILLLPLQAVAQDVVVNNDTVTVRNAADRNYKNLAKINTMALLFSNVSLLYERELGKHWTVLAAGGYRWGGAAPKVFGLGDVTVSKESNGIYGFSLTPEVRYYFNFCQCDESPSGFYAGLYARYTKYYGDVMFNVWNGEEYREALVASNLREAGVGLQMGYQFVFAKRFVVDFMFAGPRTSSYKLKADLESDDMEALVTAIEVTINERREAVGLDQISISPSSNLETSFRFLHFRYGVSFGIIF